MQLVLLSGGLGTRLWPLSDANHPKQFLKLFNKEQKSMLQITYNNISKLNLPIYVASQNIWTKNIFDQIGKNVKIISEPNSMDTFAAILNIAEYLYYKENISKNEIIAIVPIDHFVQKNFYNILYDCQLNMIKNNSDYGLIGIKPKYPNSKYGYICSTDGIAKKFVEKPNIKDAESLIKQGALWNSGILLFKIESVLKKSNEIFKHDTYEQFTNNYKNLPKTSFDYAVLENEKNISVVNYDGKWDDLGTWNTLSKYISKDDSNSNNIINYENKSIRINNIDNLIVINTSNGLLIEKKDNIVYEKWGNYQTIYNNKSFDSIITIKNMYIDDESKMQGSKCIDAQKTFFVLDGIGEIYINNTPKKIKTDDIISICNNETYYIKGIKNLNIIEVQKEKN